MPNNFQHQSEILLNRPAVDSHGVLHGCFGLTRRNDASLNGANGAVATERPALRILTANDIYRSSVFKRREMTQGAAPTAVFVY